MNAPKYILFCKMYLETKISAREAHILSLFSIFFFAEIWRERCPIDSQAQNGVEDFFIIIRLACFKIYDHFSEENVCFSNSQNLIKISRHLFLEKVVKRHTDVDRVLPPTSGRKRTYLVSLCTVGNRALYSENLNFFLLF